MHIRNIITLTCIAAIGYAMYAMQGQQGEASTMGAAAPSAMEVARVPTLQRQAAQSIARQIHDEKKTSFMLNGVQTRLDEFSETMQEMVAEAYYRLYSEEIHAQDPAKPRLVQRIQGDCNSIKALPDGSFVTAIQYSVLSDERSIERWRLEDDGTFQVLQAITTFNRPVSIAVSSDGHFLALGLARPLSVYERDANDQFVFLQGVIPIDASSGHIIKKAIYNGPSTKTLVAQYQDLNGAQRLNIYSWNNTTNRFNLMHVQDINIGNTRYHSISFNGTGDRFVVTNWAYNIFQVWSRNQDTGRFAIEIVDASLRLISAIFSPDGRYIACLAAPSGTANGLIIKSITPQGAITELQNIPLGEVCYDLRFSADSRRFALATKSGVEIWENNNNNFEYMFTLPVGNTSKVALLEDDYLVSSHSKNINLFYINIFKLHWPSIEEIWAYILNYSDMPALEEQPQSVTNAPAELSPADELKEIIEQKKAIKADASLSQEQREEQLNALRARERELKQQCQSQGTCGIQ